MPENEMMDVNKDKYKNYFEADEILWMVIE